MSATQVGKTFGLAAWLLANDMVDRSALHPSWWLAPTYSQVVAGYRLMLAMGQSAGVVKSAVMTPFPTIRLINGRVQEFRSWEREQNLMGTSISRAVVDEAGLLSPAAQAAISTRRSSTLGPVRYIGNPGIVSGPFRKLCAMAESGEMPDIYSLHRWTWRDRYDALLLEDPARAEDYKRFIEQERASLPEYEFRRLYEAEWTEDEAAVFRGVYDVTEGVPIVEPDGDDRYVFGIDVAQQTDYLVCIGIGLESRRAEVMDRYRGVPYPQAALRIKALVEKFRGTCVVEVNGPGVALTQELRRVGVRFVPFTTTSQSKQELILNLAAQLQQGRLSLADMPPLQHELAMFRYNRMPSGNYRYEAPAGEHDDTVMALAFAEWGRVRASVDLNQFGWVA